ncbi:MAG: Asp-tRNA(Asn)/Glu-tRNA(Gln) amidotransferase subunit GatB [Chloroflexota bacterium]|nr:Asp-tRNA(Asn)/Glu-tRNA(Gln) amidotransferase subunit GatB [Dehalococcoidia bacterium]MDW8252881.1 Asp-tRNA(Asn)/Glu-tRNA(Gln) amidotransferase subunit GatB [Chloroflexota bacterium]
MRYEAVIGLEVHAQLITKTKMFCSCSAAYADAPPNSIVCPICLGMPGTLPVANKQAIDYTIMTGLALGCSIPEWAKFDRKNYPYPDLMKGYQISQYDAPLCVNGALSITLPDGTRRRIGIIRVHLEEDTARLLHRADPSGETYSLIDVNRAGIPLLEIVSAPDLRTPEEAKLYLQKLRRILRYLGVSSGNMEEGSFRCDANISLRPLGATEFGAKVEIKNMNSFAAVERALSYEIARQTELLDRGERIVQETRGWVEDKGSTVGQRSKEHAHDYRYFPEPDLPPLVIDRAWVERLRAAMPELPDEKEERYRTLLGLSDYDARQLVADRHVAEYFEAALAASSGGNGRAKALANWIINDVNAVLNARGIDITAFPVRPHDLNELLDLVDSGEISLKIARDVFARMVETGRSATAIVEEQGLRQISDDAVVLRAIDEAMAENPKAVEDYRAGKAAALEFLFGKVMKATRGKANPQLTRRLLSEKLGSV